MEHFTKCQNVVIHIPLFIVYCAKFFLLLGKFSSMYIIKLELYK